MRIKALRSNYGDHGSVRRGQIVDIPDGKAQQLVKRGLFVPVQGKEAAGSAPARPSTGGRTGKAKPSSSSPEARASHTSPSTKSEDAPE